MCLAVPARVIELRDGDQAVVDLSGVQQVISVALVDGLQVGAYVIVHVGFALSVLDPEEAQETLRLFAQLDLSGDESGAQHAAMSPPEQ